MAGDIKSLDTAMSSALLRTAPRNEGSGTRLDVPDSSEKGQKGQPAEGGIEIVAHSQWVASSAEGLKKLQEMADKLNQNPLIANQLMFEVRPDEHLSIIKIVDVQTGESVRQIPSEEALARLEQIQRYLEQVRQRIEAESSMGSSKAGSARELLTGVLLNHQA